MAAITCEGLLTWVEAEACAEGDAAGRLAVYVSGAVTDDAVPVGWVRLYLDRALADSGVPDVPSVPLID